MRITVSQAYGAAGAFLGLIAIVAIAFAEPSHAAPAPAAAPVCGCHAQARVVHVRKAASHGRHHHGVIRAHAWRHSGGGVEHYGYVDRRAWRGEHGWTGEHHWADARGYSEEHSWSDEGGAWGSWEERPWATDQYGYLTWPGKTHFGHPQPGQTPMHYDGGWTAEPPMGPPPAPPEGAGPPPPPPPQPAGEWQGAPSADPDDGAYIVQRF